MYEDPHVSVQDAKGGRNYDLHGLTCHMSHYMMSAIRNWGGIVDDMCLLR